MTSPGLIWAVDLLVHGVLLHRVVAGDCKIEDLDRPLGAVRKHAARLLQVGLLLGDRHAVHDGIAEADDLERARIIGRAPNILAVVPGGVIAPEWYPVDGTGHDPSDEDQLSEHRPDADEPGEQFRGHERNQRRRDDEEGISLGARQRV